MGNEYERVPIDSISRDALAESGLRMAVVDRSDRTQLELWLGAEARGFHESRPSRELLETLTRTLAYRRATGVWDPTGPNPDIPVSTVEAWPAELTVPGERSVSAWAISGVTVAPTHRRRGIARAMLEAELRTAHSLGAPLAILTVSESTIYDRFGFAPGVFAADWRIDTRRTNWAGPAAPGRIHFVTAEQLRVEGPRIAERARAGSPGEIQFWDLVWERMLGLTSDTTDVAKHLRFVRYDDQLGDAQGFAVYRVIESEDDFSASTLEVRHLAAVTDDAYAALWRYVLEVDLIGDVIARLRSVDEPFVWQLSNYRAASKTGERDHLWVRILDLAASLEARSYVAPGRFVLEVADPLGYAAQTVELTIAGDGSAAVVEHRGAIPENAYAVSLSVNELSALYLGGVSADSLRRAGRLRELRSGSAAALDVSFRSPVTPWQSIWF